jgi:WD40 repeat protein
MTQELEIVKLKNELKDERERNAREIEILRSERANSNGSPRLTGVSRSAEIPIEGGREPLIGARRSPSKDTLSLASSPQRGGFLEGHASPLSTSSGSWSARKGSSFLTAQPQRGLVKELNSHTSDITSLYATPQFLFSGALDGNIGMWDLPSGNFKKFLTSHKGKIVTMTSVGNTMLSVADDKVVRVWDMVRALCTQHKVLRRPRPASMTTSLFMGATLVTGASDGGIHVVDTSSGVTPRPIVDYAAHNSQINCLTAQEGTIYSGAADGRIKHWRWTDAHCLSEVAAHAPGVSALSHTGTSLCSAGLDGTVRLWSTSNNVSIQSLPLFNSLSTSGTINITNGYSSPTASPPSTPNINLPSPAPTHITCLFSVNSVLYGGGSDGVVRRWGLGDGSLKTFNAHTKAISAILVVDNQLVTAAVGGQIKIWDMAML